jgi:hypothetical protein
MESEFRKLNERERELLEKLLDAEFPGRDEWRTQLDSMTGRQVIEDGTLILRCDAALPLPTKYKKLGVEGMCKDADGGDIAVLLHADDNGFLRMLEILKYDGSPVINPPSARDLVLLLPEDRGQRLGGTAAS